jgi:hypothetical protein
MKARADVPAILHGKIDENTVAVIRNPFYKASSVRTITSISRSIASLDDS